MSPLPGWFWNEPAPVPKVDNRASFTVAPGLTNMGTPDRVMVSNRGDMLRVSWPTKDGHPITFVVNGKHRKRFVLIVGWPTNTTRDPVMGWLPLSDHKLLLLQRHYENASPAEEDVLISVDSKGRWSLLRQDDSILAGIGDLTDPREGIILREVVDRWPGGKLAGDLAEALVG